jgi:hypothetical protein
MSVSSVGAKSALFKDLCGKRFGSLTAESYAGLSNTKRRRSMWLCRCDCGKEKIAMGRTLIAGQCNQCDQCLSEKLSRLSRRHGMHESREYQCWANAIQRCHNDRSPDWGNYGGRGIVVCKRWRLSFAAFLADIGECNNGCSSLDRIDVNGNYEPGNVRWATPLIQGESRRNSVKIAHNGVVLHLSEWARRSGVKRPTIDSRLRRGWTFAQAIGEEVRQ